MERDVGTQQHTVACPPRSAEKAPLGLPHSTHLNVTHPAIHCPKTNDLGRYCLRLRAL